MLFDEEVPDGWLFGKLGMELSDPFLFLRQRTRPYKAIARIIINSAAAIEKYVSTSVK